MLSAHERNEIHKAFWVHETAKSARQMGCDEIMTIAMNRITFENDRRVPPKWCSTFEGALAEAEKTSRLLTSLVIRRATRRAGSAPRTQDALNVAIRNALVSNPKLSQNDLLHALTKASKEGGDVDVDGERIKFTTARGKQQEVSTRVLKDRLSRAKKQMR
jgi:hypothetical protein